MHVTIYKNVEIEAEVNISVENITGALSEALAEATEEETSILLLDLMSSIYKCLLGTTDEMIRRMKPEHRQVVADRLSEQVDRFRVACED